MIKNSEDVKRLELLINCKFTTGDVISFQEKNDSRKYGIYLKREGDLLTIWSGGTFKCISIDDRVELAIKAMYNKSLTMDNNTKVDNIITIGENVYRLELLAVGGIK